MSGVDQISTSAHVSQALDPDSLIGMLSPRFDGLFTNLTDTFKRYDNTPRNPATVPALGMARWDLEVARAEIQDERLSLDDPHREVRTASNTDLTRLHVRLNGLVR